MFVDPAEGAACQAEACRPPPGNCPEPGTIPNTATLDISIDILPLPEEEQKSTVAQNTDVDTKDSQCPLSDCDTEKREETAEQSESSASPVPACPTPDSDDSFETQEARARVIYSFKGQADNELDVEAGEIVALLQKESHGAFVHYRFLLMRFTVLLLLK